VIDNFTRINAQVPKIGIQLDLAAALRRVSGEIAIKPGREFIDPNLRTFNLFFAGIDFVLPAVFLSRTYPRTSGNAAMQGSLAILKLGSCELG